MYLNLEENIMETNFLCPKCKGFLNVCGNIVFATKTKDGKSGLILLHEQLGNYEIIKHPKQLQLPIK